MPTARAPEKCVGFRSTSTLALQEAGKVTGKRTRKKLERRGRDQDPGPSCQDQAERSLCREVDKGEAMWVSRSQQEVGSVSVTS